MQTVIAAREVVRRSQVLRAVRGTVPPLHEFADLRHFFVPRRIRRETACFDFAKNDVRADGATVRDQSVLQRIKALKRRIRSRGRSKSADEYHREILAILRSDVSKLDAATHAFFSLENAKLDDLSTLLDVLTKRVLQVMWHDPTTFKASVILQRHISSCVEALCSDEWRNSDQECAAWTRDAALSTRVLLLCFLSDSAPQFGQVLHSLLSDCGLSTESSDTDCSHRAVPVAVVQSLCAQLCHLSRKLPGTGMHLACVETLVDTLAPAALRACRGPPGGSVRAELIRPVSNRLLSGFVRNDAQTEYKLHYQKAKNDGTEFPKRSAFLRSFLSEKMRGEFRSVLRLEFLQQQETRGVELTTEELQEKRELERALQLLQCVSAVRQMCAWHAVVPPSAQHVEELANLRSSMTNDGVVTQRMWTTLLRQLEDWITPNLLAAALCTSPALEQAHAMCVSNSYLPCDIGRLPVSLATGLQVSMTASVQLANATSLLSLSAEEASETRGVDRGVNRGVKDPWQSHCVAAASADRPLLSLLCEHAGDATYVALAALPADLRAAVFEVPRARLATCLAGMNHTCRDLLETLLPKNAPLGHQSRLATHLLREGTFGGDNLLRRLLRDACTSHLSMRALPSESCFNSAQEVVPIATVLMQLARGSEAWSAVMCAEFLQQAEDFCRHSMQRRRAALHVLSVHMWRSVAQVPSSSLDTPACREEWRQVTRRLFQMHLPLGDLEFAHMRVLAELMMLTTRVSKNDAAAAINDFLESMADTSEELEQRRFDLRTLADALDPSRAQQKHADGIMPALRKKVRRMKETVDKSELLPEADADFSENHDVYIRRSERFIPQQWTPALNHLALQRIGRTRHPHYKPNEEAEGLMADYLGWERSRTQETLDDDEQFDDDYDLGDLDEELDDELDTDSAKSRDAPTPSQISARFWRRTRETVQRMLESPELRAL